MKEENSGDNPPGELYVVATPIGNLEDLTIRALRILREVSIVLCEDTRQTRKLLNKYNIHKKLISYFHPKEIQKIPRIIAWLKEGEKIALVSDAGTPGLSDPGYPLIREAILNGIKLTPIPGASAITTALSAGGLPTNSFLFLGFPPPKKEAVKKILYSLRNEKATLVFFLPPRKLDTFFKLILETIGNRKIVIARELTKIHEEFIRGTTEKLSETLEGKKLRGEVTLLIEGLK